MSNTIQKYKDYVMTGFLKSVAPIVIDHASGVKVWDENGREYLDCFSGISVVNAGHNHPRVVAAAKAQMDKLIHCSSYLYHVRTGRRSGGKDGQHRAAWTHKIFLWQRRRRGHRRRVKAGAPLHRQTRIHLLTWQLSRTQLGHSEPHRKSGPQKTRRPLCSRNRLCSRPIRLPFAVAQRSRRVRAPMRQVHRRNHSLRHCRRRGRIHR